MANRIPDFDSSNPRLAMNQPIKRRSRLDKNVPAELAIRHAVQLVEMAGAHPLLTEAVNLLDKAREKVADYIDLPSAK